MSHDIVIDGELAIKRFDAALIAGIEPDAQRPEYKYVVYSLHIFSGKPRRGGTY